MRDGTSKDYMCVTKNHNRSEVTFNFVAEVVDVWHFDI